MAGHSSLAARRSRLRSGDGNPNDGVHGTFFQILPTPRVYARFPFFNMTNNRDTFGELVLRPAKALTIRSDVHSLALANRDDLWYSGGGMFQPWTLGYTGRPSNGQSGLATLFRWECGLQRKPPRFDRHLLWPCGRKARRAVHLSEWQECELRPPGIDVSHVRGSPAIPHRHRRGHRRSMSWPHRPQASLSS